MGASPDHELDTYDLSTHRHVVLERNSMFPANIRAQTYGFDEISRAELNSLKRRARTQAAILDDAPEEDVDALVWVIAETDHVRFGRLLDEDEIDNAVLGEEKGVCTVEGVEVFCQQLQRSKLDAWKQERSATQGDLRLLGNHRDVSGKRYLAFKDAVPLLRESQFADWIYQGPRATKEWLNAVKEGVGGLTLYHAELVRRSGISESTAVCHIHGVLCESLRLAIEIDQLDVSNSVAFELLVRRLIQDETAIARNPRHPDYGGLEVVMQSPLTDKGGAQTLKFQEWVTGRLRDQANIYKQSRLWNEEQRMRHGDREHPKGDGKGDKKNKNKKKKQKSGEDAGEED